MSNTTDRPAAETLIQEAKAVMERHHANPVAFTFGGKRYQDGCVGCFRDGNKNLIDWPCDAYVQAQRVVTLVEAAAALEARAVKVSHTMMCLLRDCELGKHRNMAALNHHDLTNAIHSYRATATADEDDTGG